MRDNRGRKQNNELIAKVQEMRKQGIETSMIADTLGISAPMVRYYARQEMTGPNRRDSLLACFLRQPKEVQERIAAEIGYIMPEKSSLPDVAQTYQKMKNEEPKEEDSLLKRCQQFLDGKIRFNEIEDYFTTDEIQELSKIEPFVAMSKAFFQGTKCVYTKEEVLEALKQNNIK